jgi:RHS repeat-associated protein
MDGNEITDEPYRYGYQGQYSEENETTAWNEFELRMYDARFGRWISPDPYGQFASPYLAMGNRPHIGSDPDGGLCCGGALLPLSSTSTQIAKSGAAALSTSISTDTTTVLPEIVVTAQSGMNLAANANNFVLGVGMRIDVHFEYSMDFYPSAPPVADVPTASAPPSAPANVSNWIPSASTVQEIAGYAGMIPGLNTVAGIVEAGAAIASGDYAGAILAGVGALPVVGVAVRWGKLLIQAHHVIPKQLIKQFVLKQVTGFAADGLRNIKRIPFPFHGNHPAYTKYVRRQLNELRDAGTLSLKEIHKLQNHLKKEIRNAWRIHKQGGGNLNDYFKNK